MRELFEVKEANDIDKKMSITHIFPTTTAHFSLGREMNDNEIKYINSLELKKNIGNKYTVNASVLQNKTMSSIREFCENSLEEYFQAVYNPKYDIKLYITQSWVNFTKTGEYHHIHNHPNSFISGVLYLDVTENEDKIFFYKDSIAAIKVIPKEWNVHNAENCCFEVKNGDLILFPSSLKHMVQTTTTQKTRVSLSFNTFLRGQLGEDESLTTLNLR